MSGKISYHKVVIVEKKPEQIFHHDSLDLLQTPGFKHHLQYYYMLHADHSSDLVKFGKAI